MNEVLVFVVLAFVLFLFAWGKIRHDIVALLALFVLVILGIVPADKAFLGFGHPAVITVAAVLIIGKGLEFSGLIDLLGRYVSKLGTNVTLQIFVLSTLVAFASAFMNNVGALAIVMPLAISMAKKAGNPVSYYLMPIAFASLLGGMTTLIGTPPNIIIATLRANETGEVFGMFDFAPVGIGLALAGLLFISFLGWRLLPKRTGQKSELESFRIEDYITELKVTENAKVAGLSIEDIMTKTKADVQILGVVRKNHRLHAPGKDFVITVNDVIIIESDTFALREFVDDTKLELLGDKKFWKDAIGSKEIAINEAIVMADSPIIGKTSADIRLRSNYGVNLLAVARREEKIHRRLNRVIFRSGDVLMLQGLEDTLNDTMISMGCLPLVRRSLRIGYKKKIATSLAIFGMSILLVMFGILPVQVAFPMAAVGLVITRILPIKQMYTSIDWPVIVLLGAMIPVGQALETQGGAATIASLLLSISSNYPIWFVLGLIMVVTMFLSDIINNAATVVLMAPIAVGVAKGLGVSIDPLLMVVAIGGSCAFLTPIGHQSNTLVMGPGGYKFSDYWRMGLPLEIIILFASIPLIMHFWPL